MAGLDDGKRIIGEDGKLVRGTLGTVVVGDGSTKTIAANTWVKITGKKSTGSGFGTLDVGDFFISPVVTAAATLPAGDTWQVLTPTEMLDLAGWSLEISADEIDTTVLADNFKKYRKGKKDANGSAKFVFIKGTTDIAGGLASQFFKIVDVSSTGTVTVTALNQEPVFLVGYIDQTSVVGNTRLATIMQVEFFNFSLPMNMGEAMNIETPFRLVGDTNPVLYRIVNA